MTIDTAWSLALTWLGRIILLGLLLLVAGWIAARFGFRLPFSANHVDLAYVAGAYWLARKAG